MSDLIRLKRSSVVGSVPTALEFGEIALNYADGVVYYKNAAGVIVALTTGTPAVVVPTDADFASVSLLLHGDGNLTDSSSLARTVTAVGTVTSNGAAMWGAGSLAFAGSGHLLVPADASLTFGGDFTIEFWVKFNAVFGGYGTFFAGDSGATQMFLTTQSNGQGIRWGLSATAEYASGSCTWTTGQWYHVAVRRGSGAVTLWVDGVNITSSTPTNTTTYTGGMVLMGGVGGVADLNGTMDDFRITRGVARTITVPTAAYPDAGPAVTTPTDAYFSSVSLLLHMDGTAASFVDSSSSPKTITVLGNATQSATQSKWGGKSAEFDGASSLTLAANAAFEFGSGDMAIEMWFRVPSASTYAMLASRDWGSGGWSFMVKGPSGGPAVYWTDYSSGAPLLSTATNCIDGAWHHIAWSRVGSSHSLYIDGTLAASATTATNFAASSGSLSIGNDAIFGGRNLTGHIDDLRITKGTARGYTGSTITVPTAAFPNS